MCVRVLAVGKISLAPLPPPLPPIPLNVRKQCACVQVLVVGKISQAAVLAASAYRNNDTFKTQTGLIKSRLIYDKQHHDTKVQLPYLLLATLVV